MSGRWFGQDDRILGRDDEAAGSGLAAAVRCLCVAGFQIDIMRRDKDSIGRHRLALALAGLLISAGFFFMAWLFHIHPDQKRPFGILGLLHTLLGPEGLVGACAAFGVLFVLGALYAIRGRDI